MAELPGVWVQGGERARAKTTWEYSEAKEKLGKKEEEAGCLTRREAPGQKSHFWPRGEEGKERKRGRRPEGGSSRGEKAFGH